MPASKHPSTPTPSGAPRAYLNSDDLLVRLMCLPEREQEIVLGALATAIDDAEQSVIEAQRLIAAARYGPARRSPYNPAAVPIQPAAA